MTYDQFVTDEGFRRHYWARNHVGWQHMRTRRPNTGHQAIARMEQRGLVTGVITQNVDLLHQAAGSQRVIDLHGHHIDVICLSCGLVLSRTEPDRMLPVLNPEFTDAVADGGVAPDPDAVIACTGVFPAHPC